MRKPIVEFPAACFHLQVEWVATRLHHAPQHKMGRRWILCEREDYARTLLVNRLTAVVEGQDQGGMTNAVSWQGGGGFRFMSLGESLLDAETGEISEKVSFRELAAHLYYRETGSPLSLPTDDSISPMIGVSDTTAYYLLYGDVVGKKAAGHGNILTTEVLRELPPHDGPRVIFAEGCRLGDDRLSRENIFFKQLPYELE